MIRAESGDGYEIQVRKLGDERLEAAHRLTVVSELVQAIGRARPYENRNWKQTVLVYCNQPLPMLVSRAMKRDQFLAEPGIPSSRKEPIKERVLTAMRKLMQVGAFTKGMLSTELGIAESSLNASFYMKAIDSSAAELGLELRIGQNEVKRGRKEGYFDSK